MTDKEKFELAAKAAGIEITTDNNPKFCNYWIVEDGEATCFWNPRDNDGDAFRLAVKLGLSVILGTYHVAAEYLPQEGDDTFFTRESLGDDPCAATRLAVFNAAVEIGKAMK